MPSFEPSGRRSGSMWHGWLNRSIFALIVVVLLAWLVFACVLWWL